MTLTTAPSQTRHDTNKGQRSAECGPRCGAHEPVVVRMPVQHSCCCCPQGCILASLRFHEMSDKFASGLCGALLTPGQGCPPRAPISRPVPFWFPERSASDTEQVGTSEETRIIEPQLVGHVFLRGPQVLGVRIDGFKEGGLKCVISTVGPFASAES